MSYDYTSFVAALQRTTQKPASNADFVAQIPSIIDQAEQRCYRELDLLTTIVRNTSGLTTPNNRLFAFPLTSGLWVYVQSINILNNTSRTPCVKVSREVLDILYPDDTATGISAVPVKYAPLDDLTVLFGPSPGSALSVELIGRVTPETLSATNPTTFLTVQLPDLFFAAAMIYATAYLQDWGAEKDNPKMALSWQNNFDLLLPTAKNEETKRKYQAFASV